MPVRHRPSISDLIIHAYVAVSYVENEGAGIGVVLETHRAEPFAEIIDSRIPAKKVAHGWNEQHFEAQGTETRQKCQLRSIFFALRALNDLYRARQGSKMPRNAVVYTKDDSAVGIIATYTKPQRKCRRKTPLQDYQKVVGKILKETHRLRKMGVEISIEWKRATNKAASRAVTLSRRKGRKSCASRRAHLQTRKTSSSTAKGEQIEGESNLIRQLY